MSIFFQSKSALFLLGVFMLNTACTAPESTPVSGPDAPEQPAVQQQEQEVNAPRASVTVNKTSEPVSLDTSDIPLEVLASTGSLTLNPEVVYKDGSRDDTFDFFIEPTEAAEKEGKTLKLLKPGRVTLHLFARQKSTVRTTLNLKIVNALEESTSVPADDDNVSEDPVVPNISQGRAESLLAVQAQGGISVEERMALNYFLADYKPGKKWTYQVDPLELEIRSLREDTPLPESIQVGWLFSFDNLGVDTYAETVRNFLAQKNLATYTIEVVDATTASVTLKTELRSNIPGLASRPAKVETYNSDTIANVYSGIIHYGSPNVRALRDGGSGEIESSHTTPPQIYSTDRYISASSLPDGLHSREYTETYMDANLGLILQTVTQEGVRGSNLFVSTTLQISLVDIQGE